jgi:hypothetical protein
MKGFKKVEKSISISIKYAKEKEDISGQLIWYSEDMICIKTGYMKFLFKKDVKLINLWGKECDEDTLIVLSAFSKKKKKKYKNIIPEFNYSYSPEKELRTDLDYKSNIPEDMLSTDALPSGYISDDFGISFSGVGSVNDK